MYDDETLGPTVLKNPGLVHNRVLRELEARRNGEITIADPNNGFCFLMEMGSSLVAQAMKAFELKYEGLYAVRATTSEQLNNHVSDMEYLRMTAKPSGTVLKLTLDRNYLAKNAQVFNNDYKKVVIPAETVFRIGSRFFGIYYPIDIRINRRTGNFVVTHDATVENSLFPLSSNAVEYVTFSHGGLDYITFTFPVYQFTKQSDDVDVVQEQGFRKSYSFNNRFYACKVYTFKGSTWQELKQTLSEDVYDTSKATAKLGLSSDVNKLTVSIPQIYFNRGLIGSKVRVEIYTTEGSLDLTISTAEAESINCDFGFLSTETTPYSAILSNIPTIILSPAEEKIVGGSNGLSFAEFRELVVTGSLHKKIPVTPLELENYAREEGFALTKHLDNITDRIYYAARTLVGGEHLSVPVTTATIQVDTRKAADISTMRTFDDRVVTLLPTTLYTYAEASGVCVPLTDRELAVLNKKSVDDRVLALNTQIYTRSPFHIVTYTDSRYPLSKCFNLMTPTVTGMRFVYENVGLAAQMTTLNSGVSHKDQGTGGYDVTLVVKKTDAMTTVPEADITVVLSTQDKSGRLVYVIGTKTGEDTNFSYYTCHIPCTYHISQDGYMRTTMEYGGPVPVSCDINLVSTFDIRVLVTKDYFPTVSQNYEIMVGMPEVLSDLLAVSQQQVTVKFGEDLSKALYSITDAQWTSLTYKTYPEDVYYTYPEDVYETNPDGTLKYTIVDGKVVLNKLHAAGDFVLDSNSEPSIQHAAGSFVRDEQNQLIPMADRELIYFVEAIMFDARLYASQAQTDRAYVASIPGELAGYVQAVAGFAPTLFERTNVYFRPRRSLGTATFGNGNGTIIRMPLGWGFKFKVYVSEATLENLELQKLIRDAVERIIASHITDSVFSLSEIGDEIRNTLKEHITSIDILGINGSVTMQTLISQDKNAIPMIGLVLVVNQDGTTSLKKDIEIEWATDK